MPVSDYIIYCITSSNIKKSLNIFNHFKNLIKKQKKNLKILFFSSGAVYGPKYKNNKFKENEKIKLNQIEKYTDYKKKYAKEKFFLEKEFLKLSNEGYKVSIVRGFTFYGKHILDYSYLISKIILAVKSKKEMKIDNPNTVRSYMHADDMCNWLIKILNNPSKKCLIVNLGSDKIIDMKKLANFLNKKFNSKIKIAKNNLKKTDFYVPSINYAKNYLKLKNTVNFYNAITLLIK